MAQTRFSNATLKKLTRGDWLDSRYPNLVFRVGERTRTWLFRLPRRPDGSRPGLKLGRFPDLDLVEAIKAYEIERGRLARKELPEDIHEQIKELEARLVALKRLAGGLVTFKALGERFLDEYVPKSGRPVTKMVHVRYRGLFANYAFPAWAERDAQNIDAGEIEALLSEMRPTAPAAANSLLKVLKTMYSWGMKRKLVSVNPCAFIAKRADNKRSRVLDRDEVLAAWHAFSGLENAAVGRALKLALLTMQRRSEVASMTWDEIAGEWWKLPEGRAKNGEPNLIYLAPIARGLLEEQGGDAKASRFVFPGIRRRDLPLIAGHLTTECHNVSAALLAAGKIRASFTVHDLRRTAATTVRSLEAPRRVVQRILNHRSRDVTDVYDLYAMKPEIRGVLTKWGEYVADLVGVTPAAG